jgi:hypothetical protein
LLQKSSSTEVVKLQEHQGLPPIQSLESLKPGKPKKSVNSLKQVPDKLTNSQHYASHIQQAKKANLVFLNLNPSQEQQPSLLSAKHSTATNQKVKTKPLLSIEQP